MMDPFVILEMTEEETKVFIPNLKGEEDYVLPAPKGDGVFVTFDQKLEVNFQGTEGLLLEGCHNIEFANKNGVFEIRYFNKDKVLIASTMAMLLPSNLDITITYYKEFKLIKIRISEHDKNDQLLMFGFELR